MSGTLTWIYGSQVVPLTGDLIIEGTEGVFGMPEVRVEASDLDTGGAYIRDIVPRGRAVMLNIAALTDAARDMLIAAMPVAASGTLQADYNGQVRILACRVERVTAEWQPWGWRIIASLLAPYPWWQGQEQSMAFAVGSQPLFFPVPPLEVASGAVFSEGMVSVGGHAAAWPQFTVTGPCDYVELTSVTMDLTLTLNQALAAGEQRIINMAPPASVTDAAGNNRMHEVSGNFWPLQAGQNTIRIVAPGADDNTTVVMTWRPSYIGAW